MFTFFLKTVFLVLFTITVFGQVLPYSVSSSSWEIFIGGILLSIIAAAFCIWSGKKLFTQGKRLINFTIILIAASALSACSTVPAGHVGIKVYLLGGSKGVDTEELGIGRYWIGINEELYLFPTFQQNYTWTKDVTEGSENDESLTFQTIEGLSVNADFGISYHVDPTKVTVLFQKYRRGLDEITDTFLRNMVRDALNKCASRLPVESVYGAGKQTLIDSVQSDVANQVANQGILIDKIYLVNDFRLPSTVVAALNAKIEATQKAQQRENEVKQAEAEAAIAKAKAEGERVRQELEAKTLTPILLQKMWIERWNGNLPAVLASDKSGMILQLPTK